MSYQVLARKWRPRYFAEMIGQEHVVRALTNALDSDRLHHAYLFTGTRGVGKTTVARIFAKSLNCEKGVSATPCGECAACVEIDEGRFIDLIEVDAASRTGVDDTRELMDNVTYAPTRGRYKVYLIDEVHMFSKSSFNALLKTLEEPPPHVKFLLATTDPQKLLATVLSRCLQFNLKRVPLNLIADHLRMILAAESLDAEDPAIVRIARSSDGSVRDSLSLLDQAIAFSGEKMMLEDVNAMLGGVSHERLYKLLDAVIAGDAAAVIDRLMEIDQYAPDYSALISDLVSLLHQIAVVQSVPDLQRDSIADPERVGQFARGLDAELVQLLYQIALNGRRDIPQAPDERDAVEMTLLRMIAFVPLSVDAADQTISESVGSAVASTLEPPTAVKRKPIETPAPVTQTEEPPRQISPPPQPVPSIAETTPAPELPAQQSATQTETPQPQLKPDAGSNAEYPEDVAQPAALRLPVEKWTSDEWPNIASNLGLQGLYAQLAFHCSLRSVENGIVAFNLSENYAHLLSDKLVQRLEQALSDYASNPIKVDVHLGEPQSETPAQRTDREAEDKRQSARESIVNDPTVQAIQERFNATIDVNAIEPHTS
ncbi:MAG: DNA polymerase III subunit gamma/tau [Pseudomonadota bacterium]